MNELSLELKSVFKEIINIVEASDGE